MRPALALAAVFLTSTEYASRADAQRAAQGFDVERLYPSAPGGGWFVMDTLDLHGGIGGSAGMTVSYARNPLRIASPDGSQTLAVVSDQAMADFGFAATYDRFRFYLNFEMPLGITGNTGSVGGYAFTPPSQDAGSNPDSLTDVRVGFDARLLGDASDAFRIGVGAQLYVPNLNNDARGDYDTDGTYRAMGRVLFAGDVGHFTYAGHVGVHIRPLDDSPTLGSPQGSELLFGVAAGSKLSLCARCDMALVVGPEVFGASAFKSLFGATTTAVEGLFTGRIEGTADDGHQVRVKLGIGAGINANFGAPEARLVFGVEIFDHSAKPKSP